MESIVPVSENQFTPPGSVVARSGGPCRPPAASEPPIPPDPSRRILVPDKIRNGELGMPEVLQLIYDEIKAKYVLEETLQ